MRGARQKRHSSIYLPTPPSMSSRLTPAFAFSSISPVRRYPFACWPPGLCINVIVHRCSGLCGREMCRAHTKLVNVLIGNVGNCSKHTHKHRSELKMCAVQFLQLPVGAQYLRFLFDSILNKFVPRRLLSTCLGCTSFRYPLTSNGIAHWHTHTLSGQSASSPTFQPAKLNSIASLVVE